MKNKKSNAGFTLVEVIVVLVIIAIMGAVMIPAFTGYIDKANKSTVISETRQCVMAAQALLMENYADNTNTLPAASAIKALAEVDGEVTELTQEMLSGPGKLLHLTYSNHGYTVIYCADPNNCAQHDETYNTAEGGGQSSASASNQTALAGLFTSYDSLTRKVPIDSVNTTVEGSFANSIYNGLSDEIKTNLNGKTWLINNSTENGVRIFFTDNYYSASDSATGVTIYKARYNADGTVSYQVGTGNVIDGKITTSTIRFPQNVQWVDSI